MQTKTRTAFARLRHARGDDGAAAVEFALVSLLLFTVLLGIMEFSLLMRDNVAISSAVRKQWLVVIVRWAGSSMVVLSPMHSKASMAYLS